MKRHSIYFVEKVDPSVQEQALLVAALPEGALDESPGLVLTQGDPAAIDAALARFPKWARTPVVEAGIAKSGG